MKRRVGLYTSTHAIHTLPCTYVHCTSTYTVRATRRTSYVSIIVSYAKSRCESQKRERRHIFERADTLVATRRHEFGRRKNNFQLCFCCVSHGTLFKVLLFITLYGAQCKGYGRYKFYSCHLTTRTVYNIGIKYV